MEPKIAEVRRMVNEAGLEDSVDVEVDGGISASTIQGAARSGANVLVAGSALFKHKDGLGAAVQELRSLANATR
jgi:ribulose-phosphate 3-epimerase